MIISVVLPAYQEAENLRTILPELNQVLGTLSVDTQVLVVDTMQSMDETPEICRENGAVYINRKGGNTYGDAIRTGFACASGTYIVVMDSDGSHDPREIPVFYREMSTGNYDLIIGSRYCRGGSTDNNLVLRLMSYALNVSYRLLFGLRVKDVSNSFRMYRTEQVKELDLQCENFDIVEEILIVLAQNHDHFSVKELPIRFQKRAAGKSKRNLLLFILTYLQTMGRLLKIKAVHQKQRAYPDVPQKRTER